ncbi:MAG: 2-dehydropantoate 2-reductase [Pseudomonadota bacterium]|nr:2-dehydropantoate 2-reductase [Pseudomonadota bacterium]
MSDRWHILGVGSIGGLFAHRLKAGGADVRLLSRDATESHRQLTLATKPDSAAHLFECESVEDIAEIEHLLITTKSWGAHDAIKRIQHRLTKHTVVVAMMNGMQHVDDLKPLIPETQLFLASTTAGCHRSGDTWVPAGTGRTIIGTDSKRPAPPWLGCWQVGVPNLSWRADMTERLVEKVAINCCINPLTAIHRVKNGELLSEIHKDQVTTVISEVSSVLDDLGYPALSIELGQRVHEVMTDTAENRSSMLNDVVAGRRTEANAIVGWLLRQTKRELPALTELATQLRALEPNQ